MSAPKQIVNKQNKTVLNLQLLIAVFITIFWLMFAVKGLFVMGEISYSGGIWCVIPWLFYVGFWLKFRNQSKGSNAKDKERH